MMKHITHRLSRLFFSPALTTRQKTTSRTVQGVGAALLLAGVTAGAAMLLGAASATTDLPAKSPRVLPVETTAIRAIDAYDVQRSFTGVLVAARNSQLSFELGGKVLRIDVDQGDHVESGQALARLDTRQLQARQDELQAQRDQAAAILAELVAGPRQEKIAAAQAEVADLKAQVEWQQTRHTRRHELRERNVIAQEEFDESRFSLAATQARHNAAARRLDELLAGTRVEQIAAQRAAVDGLDAALAQVAVELSDSVIAAPFAGTVALRYIDEGSIVAAGSPVLRLVEDAAIEAHIGLTPRVAQALQPGDAHTITVAGNPYPATVEAVLPELDATTRTRTVVFLLDAAAIGRLVPGEVARVEIAQQIATDGFWLPTTSLDRGTRGLWSAMAVVPTSGEGAWLAERRYVEVLHTDADRVLVRGTLQAGEQVVAVGVHRIVDGQIVKPVSSGGGESSRLNSVRPSNQRAAKVH